MNLLLFKLANIAFGNGMMLVDYSWDEIEALAFLEPIVKALEDILPAILIVVGTAGTIYAVVLGVNMAKAETADKREEAKKRVINVIMALVITIVLILLFRLFISELPGWLGATPLIPE